METKRVTRFKQKTDGVFVARINHMPRRTNDFQKLIKLIYEKITPQDGTVTESGMIRDKDSNELREVDILVEYKYAGHEFKFIIECRDHLRKQSVEWIDALIGKANSLNVNKVIAVSSTGFSKAALVKAKVNNIETFSLQQAEDTNWGEFPFKPGIALLSSEVFTIKDVFYKNGNEFVPITQLNIGSQIQINGENTGTLKECIEGFFQTFIIPQIESYIKENFMQLFPTREDVEKFLISEREYTWPVVEALDNDGNKVNFTNIKYVILSTRKVEDVQQDHKVYGDKVISLGKHQDTEGSKYDFVTIQDPDTRKIHFRWEKKK